MSRHVIAPRHRLTASAISMIRRLITVVCGAAALAAVGTAAMAFWSADGGGSGSATSGTMSAPTNVFAASPGGDTVAVSWEAASLGNGQPADGYYVTRVKDSDGINYTACGTSASSPTTSLSCDDLAVADGTYHYTVTAQHGSWTSTSAASVSVTVVAGRPDVTVSSISPTPNANGYNNTTPVVVNLSATDASGIASITYRINAGAPVTVAAATAAVSVSGNGIHTVTFSAKDNTGVDSLDQYQTVRIDTVLPAAPQAPTLTAASDTGTSSTDRISNDSTPTFSGTAEAGSTITLYNSGIAVGTAVVEADGTYAVTSSVLTSGAKTITVRNTDLAGNLGPASPSTTITLDYTAPLAPTSPTLSSGSDSGRSTSDRITNDTTPTFTGIGTTSTVSVTLHADGIEVGSNAASAASYTATSSVLADGVRSMTAKVSDAAGNVSTASSATTVTIDTVAPNAPSAPVLAASSDTGSSSSDGITSDTTPTFTGTNESLAIVSLRADAAQVGTTTTIGASYTVTSSPRSNGDHTFTTTATDVAGNLGPASAGTTITIDTIDPIAPSAPVLTAESDSGVSSSDRITNDTTPTLTGTAAVGSFVTIYNGATPVGSAVTAIDGTYTITTDPLTSGSKSLTARGEPDVAGNVGISSTTTVTIDNTAPLAPEFPTPNAASDSGRSATDRITNDTTPTFTGTGTTGAVAVTLYDDGTEVGAGTSTSFTYTVTATPLTDGVHSMTAKVSDAAGNLSAASTIRTVTIDTTAPDAPSAPVLAASSDTGSSSSDGITSDTTPTFTGTNESLAIVSLREDAGQVGTTTTIGTTYTVTSSPMSNGDHTVTATATDVAGNLGPASAGTTITIDTVAPSTPSAPVLTAASDSGVSSSDRITNVPTPTVAGTAVPGSTVTIYSSSTLVGTGVTAPDGTYTITTDALASGARTLTARGEPDVAGNVAISASTIVTMDFAAPTVTVNEGAAQAGTTTTSPIEFRVQFNSTVYGFSSSGVTLSGTANPTTAVVTGSGSTYDVNVSGMNRDGTVIATVAAGQAQDVAGNLNLASTSTDNTVTYDDIVAPTVSITGFVNGAGHVATISGLAGILPGDNSTVTVVLCTTNVTTCTAGGTKATLTADVDPATGAWSVTSGNLGPTPVLYARAKSSDLSGNLRTSSSAGPIATRP